MIFRLLLLFSTAVHPVKALASIEVAFIEIHDSKGQLVQFEKNGRFGHSAIHTSGIWYQAHPWRGVEATTRSEVAKVGCIAEIVRIPDREINSAKFQSAIEEMLGRPFDHDYSWDDEKVYCAEFVAKALDVKPTPMVFDPSLWPEKFQKHAGEPGASPDGLYREFKARGYESFATDDCARK